jgi:hypothetical protein
MWSISSWWTPTPLTRGVGEGERPLRGDYLAEGRLRTYGYGGARVLEVVATGP